VTGRRDTFYTERDRRTRQYGGTDNALERPVLIVVGPDAARTRAGQIAALALVNMAARVHRRIGLIVPDAPLLAKALIPATDLPTAAMRTARAINPVLDLYLEPEIEKRAFAASIGLGTDTRTDLDVYLDWDGGLGVLGHHTSTLARAGPGLGVRRRHRRRVRVGGPVPPGPRPARAPRTVQPSRARRRH
jgi:hypothetical protein